MDYWLLHGGPQQQLSAIITDSLPGWVVVDLECSVCVQAVEPRVLCVTESSDRTAPTSQHWLALSEWDDHCLLQLPFTTTTSHRHHLLLQPIVGTWLPPSGICSTVTAVHQAWDIERCVQVQDVTHIIPCTPNSLRCAITCSPYPLRLSGAVPQLQQTISC